MQSLSDAYGDDWQVAVKLLRVQMSVMSVLKNLHVKFPGFKTLKLYTCPLYTCVCFTVTCLYAGSFTAIPEGIFSVLGSF